MSEQGQPLTFTAKYKFPRVFYGEQKRTNNLTPAENVNDEAKSFVSVKIKSRDFDRLLKRSSTSNLVF